MALQIVFEDAAGVVHPEAYTRMSKFIVDNPVGGKASGSFNLDIYANRKTRDGGKFPVWGSQGYTFFPGKPAGEIRMSDGYDYLKNLDMFKGAADV